MPYLGQSTCHQSLEVANWTSLRCCLLSNVSTESLSTIFLSATTIGNLQGHLDAHIILAANMSFTALSTVYTFGKGSSVCVNLIGGWFPVSILILLYSSFLNKCSFPQDYLHSVLLNPQLFLYDKWVWYFIFCFKSSRECTLCEVYCSSWLRLLTFTKLNSFTFSILQIAFPFLSQISLLVLLIRKTDSLPCLLVSTIELTVSRPCSLLMVLFSLEIAWWNSEFYNCSLPLAMHRQNFTVCSLIIVCAVSLANEGMCMSSSILTLNLSYIMQPKS